MENEKILSKEEMDELKQISPKKQILKWVYLGIGIVLFVFSILFFIFEWTVEFFVIEMTYDEETTYINLSVFFGIILLATSLILMSQFLINTNYYNENSFNIPKWHSKRESLLFSSKKERLVKEVDLVKFRSFASSRFVASILMIGMAGINISVFGTDLDTENHIGSWFFLGGPSMFYPMSAFMLLVGFGLLIYSIFSTVNLVFSKSQNFYFIEEFRFPIPWITEIPKNDVLGARLTNSKMGPKYFWIILMGFNLILCFTDGFHFLLNPFAFGSGLLVGKFYVLTAFVHLIALLILLLKHQTLLEIVTKEKRYEINFNIPAVKSPNIVEELKYCFDMNVSFENDLKIESFTIKDWRNIIVGAIFLLTGIISVVTFRYAGDPLRIVLYIFGFILIIKGFTQDFSNTNGIKIFKDGNNSHSEILISRKWLWFDSAYKFNNSESKYDFRLEKLNFFDILMIFLLPFGISLDLCGVIYLIPGITPGLIWIKVLHIFGDLILMLLILNVIIRPVNKLIFKNESLTYEYNIPGALSKEQMDLYKGKNFLKMAFYKWKYVILNQKEAFLQRILGILLSFLVGCFFMGKKTQVLGIWLTVLILIVLIAMTYFIREILMKRKRKK
ncbi:MAG: hypothetical protein ACTSYY_10180 [Promethearchaeota archaeon]